jgi:PEP-CTERM motif
MKSIDPLRVRALWILTVVTATTVVTGPRVAQADLIYNVTAANSNDFVPFENDGTPNRPFGDHLGNQITFAGTARYLDHVQVVFASIGPKEIDTYTLDLYKNDGAINPTSGLHEPGTLIAHFTTQASNVPLPGNGGYGVDWNFAPTLVPDTLTAVVSSSYSITTPGQLMGPFVAVVPPLTGSALNTMWYGDGTPGNWQASSTWAINDGGVTNFIDMRFDALQSVPEPSSMCLMAIGAGCGISLALRRLSSTRPRNRCQGQRAAV